MEWLILQGHQFLNSPETPTWELPDSEALLTADRLLVNPTWDNPWEEQHREDMGLELEAAD